MQSKCNFSFLNKNILYKNIQVTNRIILNAAAQKITTLEQLASMQHTADDYATLLGTHKL